MYCERVLNLAPDELPLPMEAFTDIVKETTQHAHFMCSNFVATYSLTPYATELLVWFSVDQAIVSAGQVDAVMQSKETGEFFLIDWKRVNKKHELTPNAQPFANRYGFGECSAIPDTHFHKYSLQCSIYATMLKHSHGFDVGARLYLVRMHEDRDNYEVVHCHDWRSVAQSLLKAEHARLMSKRAQEATQDTPAEES